MRMEKEEVNRGKDEVFERRGVEASVTACIGVAAPSPSTKDFIHRLDPACLNAAAPVVVLN